ncbi:MAG: deoxyhypusine synthase [bacterium]|nr:deoxyhypusine synthase [bacterium]
MHNSESSEKPTCPGRDAWLNGPQIEPLELAGNEHTAELIDNVYARSGFNARRLAEAAGLYSWMIDDGATVALTLAGAMTPIGMSGVLNSLIEAGFIDVMVSTGANLFHDLARPFNLPMVQGHHEVDDNALLDDGIARIYDVFITEDDHILPTDEAVLKAVRRLDHSRPFSTASLHHELGRVILETAPHPEKSLLATAAKYGVPIYTSSPGDSVLALLLIPAYLLYEPIPLNPLRDVIELMAIVFDAERTGVVEIGGGSPKNFFLQTQPMLQQMLGGDLGKGGHEYFLQLTVDAPHWGGLSGATPSEAKSWGKVRDAHTDNVVVYSCASLTLPLIAQYALTRNRPREPRGLMARVPDLAEKLRRATDPNKVFAGDHAGNLTFAEVWERAGAG